MELREKIKEIDEKIRKMEQSFSYLSRYAEECMLRFKFKEGTEERKNCIEFLSLKKKLRSLLIKNDIVMIKEVISQMSNEDKIGIGDYVEYDGYVGAVSRIKYRKDDYLKKEKYVEFYGFNVKRGDYYIICELEEDVNLLVKCPLEVTKSVKERSIDFDY